MTKKETPALTKLAIAGLDFKHVKINLLGHDGNAAAIIGSVRRALRKGGAPRGAIDAFVEEAMSGDYDNVLQTVFRWVTVTGHCECCGEDDE